MEWIYLHFKLKIIAGIILISIALVGLIYIIISMAIKETILKRNGFVYRKGLGTNVAVEFQDKYVKGNKSIRYKEVDRMSVSELIRTIRAIKGE